MPENKNLIELSDVITSIHEVDGSTVIINVNNRVIEVSRRENESLIRLAQILFLHTKLKNKFKPIKYKGLIDYAIQELESQENDWLNPDYRKQNIAYLKNLSPKDAFN